MHQLPFYDLPVRTENGVKYLYDVLRKKYVVQEPEEYVRQCLIRFLMEEKQFPPALMSAERAVPGHRQNRRYDLLTYDRNAQPLLLAECKEPRIPVNDKAVMQLASYNAPLTAKYLLVTNGSTLLLYRHTAAGYTVSESFPGFEDMLTG